MIMKYAIFGKPRSRLTGERSLASGERRRPAGERFQPRARFRAYARFMGAATVANFQSVIEYRASFLLQVFGMMLNNGAFALFWAVLIGKTGGVGGYGFSDIMFVWALVSTAFGIAHVVFGNVRSIGRIVMEGELDLYLLQPKNVMLNILASRTVVSAWGDLIYGFIVLAMLPGFGIGRLALFAALSLSGSIILTAIFAAAESLTFFMGNSSAVSQAAAEFMLSFSLYPESIHGAGTRWLLYTILPSAFVAFVPLAAFTRMDWLAVPLLFGIAAVYMTASHCLFSLGLRRYESGNQIGMRL